jgi:hypothetical protein
MILTLVFLLSIINKGSSFGYASLGCTDPDCENLESEINPCQNLNSKDCPYNYNNTMPDYEENMEVAISSRLQQFMEDQLPIYLNTIESHYPPSDTLSKSDTADVFSGTGGRAYMFLRMYDRSGRLKVDYLKKARQYIDMSLAYIDTIDKNYVGFLWGRTGVHCVAAVISDLEGHIDDANNHIQEVQSIIDHSVDDNYAKWDDFDAGRAGLLYASSFLKKHFQKEVISQASVVAIGQAIITRGQAVSKSKDYLQWLSPNDGESWVGTSHGSSGILSQLLDVKELLVEDDGTDNRRLIVGTIDYVLSTQFPSGNFPSEYYDEDDDVLVQWDHGAPGVLGCMSKAASVLKNSTYMDSAKLAADCTWERGLVTKGLMLCHGITGNTYMQIYLYKVTKDVKYLYRALQFQEFVSQTPELYDLDLMRYPTPNPYYLYSGSFESAVMLWVDLLSTVNQYGDPYMTLAMPGYEPSL